jgi:hypothetical protein
VLHKKNRKEKNGQEREGMDVKIEFIFSTFKFEEDKYY